MYPEQKERSIEKHDEIITYYCTCFKTELRRSVENEHILYAALDTKSVFYNWNEYNGLEIILD